MKPITLSGRIEKKDDQSSTVGCSVAKIAIEQGMIIPALGVYFSEAEIGTKKINSVAWINDGRDGKTLRLEVCLLDSEEDLAGKIIKVTLLEKVRSIISFPGDKQMAKTIQEDLNAAKEWFQSGD